MSGATASERRDAWVAAVVSRLRARRCRTGAARCAVIDVLADQRSCMTAQEIHDRIGDRELHAAPASVYRTLELLVSEGFVQRLDLGAGVARYQPVGASAEHHHHFVCDLCGSVEPFEDGGLERALARVAAQSDRAIVAHEVTLHGSCAGCRAKATGTPQDHPNDRRYP